MKQTTLTPSDAAVLLCEVACGIGVSSLPRLPVWLAGGGNAEKSALGARLCARRAQLRQSRQVFRAFAFSQGKPVVNILQTLSVSYF